MGDWDLTADLLDGVSINCAPDDTNPASNQDWQTILGQFGNVSNTMTEIVRSEVSRNPTVIGGTDFNAIGGNLQQKFQVANNFYYDIDHPIFYDNATTCQGTTYNYRWTKIEAQHLGLARQQQLLERQLLLKLRRPLYLSHLVLRSLI